jgi:flagellar L-ring protein precursor FlgH
LFSKSYNNSFFRFLPWAKKAVGADGENGNGANAVSTATEFKGTGDADQNNSLSGIITVSVTEILPNDNLHIKGEKWITLSNGSEFIRLSGIVRPQDIGANNEIISTKIADARISYSGKGDVQRATVPGWLAKFFNATFFPF